MLIATWNLNNRAGKTRFRPETAEAAISLNVDVFVFTEYYPRLHHDHFCGALLSAGYIHQFMSVDTKEVANHIFIASRLPMQPLALDLPDFDGQFPSNVLGAFLPSIGISILGVRIPAYKGKDRPLLGKAWEWLSAAAIELGDSPSVILGDLNVSLTSKTKVAREPFHAMMKTGWHRATPTGGASYFGLGGRQSEIDHILASTSCAIDKPCLVTSKAGYLFAGFPGTLSDHAALTAEVTVGTGMKPGTLLPIQRLTPKRHVLGTSSQMSVPCCSIPPLRL